jgi:hypothetical protein
MSTLRWPRESYEDLDQTPNLKDWADLRIEIWNILETCRDSERLSFVALWKWQMLYLTVWWSMILSC